jgi:hypothetical protein
MLGSQARLTAPTMALGRRPRIDERAVCERHPRTSRPPRASHAGRAVRAKARCGSAFCAAQRQTCLGPRGRGSGSGAGRRARASSKRALRGLGATSSGITRGAALARCMQSLEVTCMLLAFPLLLQLAVQARIYPSLEARWKRYTLRRGWSDLSGRITGSAYGSDPMPPAALQRRLALCPGPLSSAGCRKPELDAEEGQASFSCLTQGLTGAEW